jgi:hypothetical protein
VGVGVGVGVATGVGVGFGLTTTTPLFQTSFLPLFTHVYFLPATVEVCPAFLQLAPALIAAFAFNGATRAKIRTIESRYFFIGEVSRVVSGIATTRPYKHLIQIKKPAT